ncbi:MAG: hypothetical protein ABSE89_11380 [Sedimentisphaerales bacterium]
MSFNQHLSCLQSKWQELLENRGHRIYHSSYHPDIIRSRNGFRKRYRWILLTGEDAKRTLTKTEQLHIRHHLKQAEAQRETAYLVVGFVEEPRRIIVLPARMALNASFVRSDKGGIAWTDKESSF